MSTVVLRHDPPGSAQRFSIDAQHLRLSLCAKLVARGLWNAQCAALIDILCDCLCAHYALARKGDERLARGAAMVARSILWDMRYQLPDAPAGWQGGLDPVLVGLSANCFLRD